VAKHVIYRRNGQTITVTATKEIILSAGAFGTPAILQRYGVGPSDVLKSLNASA
jgi:choline dehydrogenase